MRNVSPIAEQELEQMFQKHGTHVAVCEALLKEMDDEIAAIEKRFDDQHAEWERLGLNPRYMEKAKKARPKKVKSEIVEESKPEVQVDLATLIEEQEKERRHDALVSALALAAEKENEENGGESFEENEEDDIEERDLEEEHQ